MLGKETRALAPIRDPQATLVDLLEVILNKGVLLNVDLLISVADVPLVGVSVRAAIAGIETMLEHGMMREWDESTRRWVQQSIARDLALHEKEELRLRMLASLQVEGLGRTWRPGVLYVTDRRVVLLRREPREVLLEVSRADLVRVVKSTHSDPGVHQSTLTIVTREGRHLVLLPADARKLARVLRLPAGQGGKEQAADRERSGRLWFHEPRALGGVWRNGRATLAGGILEWRAVAESRPAFRMAVAELSSVQLEPDHPAVGAVVRIEHAAGSVRLGGDLQPWIHAISRAFGKSLPAHGGT